MGSGHSMTELATIEEWMRSSRVWMRSSQVWMRYSRVVEEI
jgi:hypothetical protein